MDENGSPLLPDSLSMDYAFNNTKDDALQPVGIMTEHTGVVRSQKT